MRGLARKIRLERIGFYVLMAIGVFALVWALIAASARHIDYIETQQAELMARTEAAEEAERQTRQLLEEFRASVAEQERRAEEFKVIADAILEALHVQVERLGNGTSNGESRVVSGGAGAFVVTQDTSGGLVGSSPGAPSTRRGPSVAPEPETQPTPRTAPRLLPSPLAPEPPETDRRGPQPHSQGDRACENNDRARHCR